MLLCQHKLHMKPTTYLCSVSFNDVKCAKILFFYIFYCNLKEKDHIKRNINNKKQVFIYEISIVNILICQKLGLVGSVQQKIKLPAPKLIYWKGVIIEPRLKSFSKVHLTFVGEVLLSQRIVNSGFDINHDCFFITLLFFLYKIPSKTVFINYFHMWECLQLTPCLGSQVGKFWFDVIKMLYWSFETRFNAFGQKNI